jgi:hypothetical protein
VSVNWLVCVKPDSRNGCLLDNLDSTLAWLSSNCSISPGSSLFNLQVDYSGLGVQQVWDCTGVFLTRKALQPYFDAGVPKVVVSAPVKDAERPVLNIVYGVNHVSNGWRQGQGVSVCVGGGGRLGEVRLTSMLG